MRPRMFFWGLGTQTPPTRSAGHRVSVVIGRPSTVTSAGLFGQPVVVRLWSDTCQKCVKNPVAPPWKADSRPVCPPDRRCRLRVRLGAESTSAILRAHPPARRWRLEATASTRVDRTECRPMAAEGEPRHRQLPVRWRLPGLPSCRVVHRQAGARNPRHQTSARAAPLTRRRAPACSRVRSRVCQTGCSRSIRHQCCIPP